jgi:Ion channel
VNCRHGVTRPLRSITRDVDFADYTKVFWFVVVTMSTVGYGDITPKTLPGRFLAFLLSIWGVFIISLVVLIFFNFMQLDDQEIMSLKVYDRMNYRDEMIKEAALVLGKMAKIRKYYKDNSIRKVKRLASGFKRNIENFRQIAE